MAFRMKLISCLLLTAGVLAAMVPPTLQVLPWQLIKTLLGMLHF